MEFAGLLVDYEDELAPSRTAYEKACPIRADMIELVGEMDDEIDSLRAQLEIAKHHINNPPYYMDGHEMGQG